MSFPVPTFDTESAVRVFGIDHVMQLTGLSKHQLAYWDSTGFFRPALAFANRRSPYSRVYSFKDVVGLRVLSILRRENGIPLSHLRKTASELSKYTATPWADITLYVLGKEVYFNEPDTGKMRGVVSKQYTSLPLLSVIDDLRARSLELLKRTGEQFGRVERHRFVAHNAWVVAGTRIPIASVQRMSDAGYTAAEILAEYPTLTEADVEAALRHSAKLNLAA